LLLPYVSHVPHSDTAASAWVVPCKGVLPSQIELVGSVARLFLKVLRLPIAGPALPQRYASGRMDGRNRVEKKKGIGGGCCQMCQAYRFIFKRTNTSGNW